MSYAEVVGTIALGVFLGRALFEVLMVSLLVAYRNVERRKLKKVMEEISKSLSDAKVGTVQPRG